MKIFFLSLLLIMFQVTFGQQDAGALPEAQEESGLDRDMIESAIQKRKLSVDLEFGTAFGASRYGSYFGTFVSPRLNYPVSNRWTLSAGAYFSGLSPINSGQEAMAYGNPYSGLYSRTLVYVSGAYMLNENLTLTGTAYREINPFGAGSVYPGFSHDSHGVIMGVHYKVSDHVFIRGEIEVNNGNRPYHYSPFRDPYPGSGMYDPLFLSR